MLAGSMPVFCSASRHNNELAAKASIATAARAFARRCGQHACQPWLITMMADQDSSAIPSGLLRRRPQGMFFSIAIMAASRSIQPRLPVPSANINSISAQQQPTQNRPW